MRALILMGCLLLATPAVAALTAAEGKGWHEDLALLARELPRRHLDFYRAITPAQFADSVRKLDARIPRMGRPQFAVGLLRLVAMAGPGNGHTYLFKTGDTFTDVFTAERNTPDALANLRTLGFGQLPVGFHLFRDSLYVNSAAPGYEDLLGARVTRIGRASGEDAMRAVTPLVAKDNAEGARANGPRYLAVPEILVGLRLTDDPGKVPLEVETPAGPVKRTLERLALDTPLIAQRPATVPLAWAHTDRYFWAQELPKQRAWYVQWNAVRDTKEQKAADFFTQTLDAFDRGPATRLILDLRWNPGGNTSLTQPVLLRLIRSPKLREHGSLVVLIGRETFSAAMNFCLALEYFTPAVFVGEPTGGSCGFFGDNAPLTLPHTGLVCHVSYVWWQLMDSRDERPWIAPGIAAEPSEADFAAGRDPALEAALDWKPPFDWNRAIADSAVEGPPGVKAALAAWRADARARWTSVEDGMNLAGYRLLGAGRTEEAIAVFGLGIELYPRSWNLYDSRGEANARAGHRTAALADYKHSLALDPQNANAADEVAKLR